LPVPVQNLFSETYESIGQLVGPLGRGIGLTQGLHIHTGQHNTEKRGHTSMPRLEFELTIPVFELPKTVRASDRSAIGIGYRERERDNLIKKGKRVFISGSEQVAAHQWLKDALSQSLTRNAENVRGIPIPHDYAPSTP
jgi:hypothetical protein